MNYYYFQMFFGCDVKDISVTKTNPGARSTTISGARKNSKTVYGANNYGKKLLTGKSVSITESEYYCLVAQGAKTS